MQILKKLFSLLISAFAVLILGGFFNLHPIAEKPVAYASGADPETCTYIAGMTDTVLSPAATGRMPNVADPGNLNFDVRESTYQACVQNEPTAEGDTNLYAINGWAWNTNLGDISFSCTSGDNFGASCGTQDYNAILTADAAIRGFAWGDNIGWISLGCDAGLNNGVACGGIDYGVQVAIEDGEDGGSCGILNAGDIYGYAWNDSVGWINFCGAHIDLGFFEEGLDSGIEPVVTFDTVRTSAEGGVVAEGDVLDGLVYANGADAYRITLQFKNEATDEIFDVEEAGYSLTNVEIDFGGYIRTDQVVPCSNQPGGACTNALILPTDFEWSTDSQFYFADIKSIAPTNTENTVRLESLAFTLRDAEGAVVESFEMPSEVVVRSFEFAAPVSVSRIAPAIDGGDETGDSSLRATANTSEEMHIWANLDSSQGALPLNDSIEIYAQLYDCNTTDGYAFVFDPEFNGVVRDNTTGEVDNEPLSDMERETATAGEFYNMGRTDTVCAGGSLIDVNDAILLSNFYDGGARVPASIIIYSSVSSEGEVAVMSADALGMDTIVSYTTTGITGQNVRYFSHPVSSGSVQDQAALVRGDIGNYIRDVNTLPVVGRIRQSLGENAQSKREIFYREIRKVIGNQPSADFSDGGINGIKVINQAALGTEPRIGDNKILYYRCNSDRPVLATGATVPCMIILDDEDGTLEINDNMTIVAIGADIYIDSNIRGSTIRGDAGANDRLAIIALEDLARSEERKGGNGYLCASVTDVELNAVFDNTLFSYGNSETDCGENTVSDKSTFVRDNGIPNVSRGPGIAEIFKRQLAWTGTLTSNNTYGGATAIPQIMGDGTAAETREQKMNARWYDVNFLRWAHVVDGAIPGTQCWADDVTLSSTIGTSCDSNDPMAYGIVNFFYSPAPKEQAIFNVEM